MQSFRSNLRSLALVSICVAAAAANAQERIAIKAGRLIDGTGAPAIDKAVIIVHGDRIEAVGKASSTPIPRDVRVIDLSADTVLPGLIDGHSHPTVRPAESLQPEIGEMKEPVLMQGARGVRDLRVDLLSGVTSDYVVGELND